MIVRTELAIFGKLTITFLPALIFLTFADGCCGREIFRQYRFLIGAYGMAFVGAVLMVHGVNKMIDSIAYGGFPPLSHLNKDQDYFTDLFGIEVVFIILFTVLGGLL